MEVSLNFGTFLIMMVNFIILMAILWRLLYHPIQDLLEQRKKKISDDLSEAEKSRQTWDQKQQEAKKSLAKAQTEAAEMVEKARNEAERLREEILDKARHEAEDLRQRTLTELDRAKVAAQAELREGAVTLALVAATKVVGAKMTKEINESLVRGVLDSIEKGA